MVKPVEVSKAQLKKEPNLLWNTFISLIVQDPFDLDNIQSVAHFAFTYDSEVNNSGHQQYFENMYSRYKDKESIAHNLALEALKIIGAKAQYKIFEEAKAQYESRKRRHPSNVEEFAALECEKEFEKLDNLYYGAKPGMNSYLEKFLNKYRDSFVKLV